MNYLGGGVEGCCPSHYIVHRKSPGLVGWQGLILCQGVGTSIGRGLQERKLGESLLGHGQRMAVRAVGEGSSGKLVKFVRHSYEIDMNSYQIYSLAFV